MLNSLYRRDTPIDANQNITEIGVPVQAHSAILNAFEATSNQQLYDYAETEISSRAKEYTIRLYH